MTGLAAVGALTLGSTASAAVISYNNDGSFRFQQEAIFDYTLGSGPDTYPVTGRVLDSARVGRSGGGIEFTGIYSYLVTQEFADDINGGGTAQLDISTGSSIGGVTPGTINISLLQVTGADPLGAGPGFFSQDFIVDSVIEPAIAGGLLGVLTSPSVSTDFAFDITTQLNSAVGSSTLNVGDVIWIGADAVLDPTVTGAQNIELGQQGITNTLTSVPEPGTFAVAGLGGLALLGRRRTA
ncbi:MAG: PEP-CTERM sorting domain-containing protein [Planctomycetota bacterium]